MKSILFSSQMRMAEDMAVKSGQISLSELMDNAGQSVYQAISELMPSGRILVICGGGGNGGDGYVTARLLQEKYMVNVLALTDKTNALCQEKKMSYFGKYVDVIDNQYDMIVDAIIGIGLKEELRDNYQSVVKKINEFKGVKLSIDIPTGLNSDNGLVMGNAIKADYTVALGTYKYGHFLNDGKDFCGKVILKEIGIAFPNYASLTHKEMFKDSFPKRLSNSHKGTYGCASIIATSAEMLGAGLISFHALAALRMGSGYAMLCIPKKCYNSFALKVPEATLLLMNGDDKILFDKEILDKIIFRSRSIAIGMGLGVSKDVYLTIEYLLKNFSGTVILDADALNTLSQFDINVLKEKKANVVLTPHIKEFSRLCNCEVNKVIADSVNLATCFAKTYDVTLVLKSNTTIITNGDEIFINSNGTPCLAKGGSGDILSGIMAGIFSYTRETEIVSAALATFVLGKASEMATEKLNEYSVVASDVVDNIPYAINELRK